MRSHVLELLAGRILRVHNLVTHDDLHPVLSRQNVAVFDEVRVLSGKRKHPQIVGNQRSPRENQVALVQHAAGNQALSLNKHALEVVLVFVRRAADRSPHIADTVVSFFFVLGVNCGCHLWIQCNQIFDVISKLFPKYVDWALYIVMLEVK